MKPRGIRCLKFFLTFFNVVIIVFALALLTLCVANMRDKRTLPVEVPIFANGVVAFLVALSFGLMTAAALGCIGAVRERVRVLYAHAFFMIFLVSVELVVGVGAAVISAWVGGGSEMRAQFYRNSTDEMEQAQHQYYWETIQSENRCCGVDGPLDYSILHREIPHSCCARAHPLRDGGARRQIHATCLAEQTFYNRGCEEVLRMKKAVKGNIFVISLIVFTCLDVLSVGLALWLGHSIRAERQKLQANLQAHFES